MRHEERHRNASCGSRRLVEQQSKRTARGVSQQQESNEHEQQRWFSLRKTFRGAHRLVGGGGE